MVCPQQVWWVVTNCMASIVCVNICGFSLKPKTLQLMQPGHGMCTSNIVYPKPWPPELPNLSCTNVA